MKDFFASVMNTIKKAVDTQFNGNISRASQAWGVTGDNLHKWLRVSIHAPAWVATLACELCFPML